MRLFLLSTDHRHIFSFLGAKGYAKKCAKKLLLPNLICSKSMFTVWKHKAFPNWKSVWFHLSTVWQIWQKMRHLTNHSMITEYGIMEQRHQRHVSRLCPSFSLPSPPLSSLCLPNFFCHTPFPHCRAWSQTPYTKESKSVFLCLTLYTHLTTNRPIKGPKTMDIKYTEPAMYADSFLVKSKVSL